MKKLVLLLAVVFSVSLFSCSNAEQNTEATDTAAVAPVEEVTPAPADSINKDSIPAEAAPAEGEAAPAEGEAAPAEATNAPA